MFMNKGVRNQAIVIANMAIMFLNEWLIFETNNIDFQLISLIVLPAISDYTYA